MVTYGHMVWCFHQGSHFTFAPHGVFFRLLLLYCVCMYSVCAVYVCLCPVCVARLTSLQCNIVQHWFIRSRMLRLSHRRAGVSPTDSRAATHALHRPELHAGGEEEEHVANPAGSADSALVGSTGWMEHRDVAGEAPRLFDCFFSESQAFGNQRPLHAVAAESDEPNIVIVTGNIVDSAL